MGVNKRFIIERVKGNNFRLTQLPHLLSKNTSELGSKECKVVDNIMFYFNISKIVTNRLVKL
jgi:hypothetical protein